MDDEPATLDLVGTGAFSPAPAGVLPAYPFVDAHAALGWIAWRTVTWAPADAADMAARQADLDRAHTDLVAALAEGRIAAMACRPAAYVTEGFAGVSIAPAGVAEPIPAATFATPGLRIETHGYVTARHRPLYTPDDGAELPLFLALRLSTAGLAEHWPPPAAPTRRTIAAAELERTYAAHVALHVAAGSRPSVADTRAALNAAFPGAKPSTDRQVRSLRALSITPPEWRQQGRHRGG